MHPAWIILPSLLLVAAAPANEPAGTHPSPVSLSQPVEQPAPVTPSVASTAADLDAAPTATVTEGKRFGPGVNRTADGRRDKGSGFGLLRYFGSMAAMLAIFGGAFVLLHKYRRRLQGGGPTALLEVRSRVTIGTRHSLVVVRIHEEDVLLGVGPEQITTLARYAALDDEDGPTVEADPEARPPAAESPFRKVSNWP